MFSESSCDCVATKECHHEVICDSVASSPEGSVCPFERRSLLEELAAKGVRLTAQRRVLVEIIQGAEKHLGRRFAPGTGAQKGLEYRSGNRL